MRAWEKNTLLDIGTTHWNQKPLVTSILVVRVDGGFPPILQTIQLSIESFTANWIIESFSSLVLVIVWRTRNPTYFLEPHVKFNETDQVWHIRRRRRMGMEERSKRVFGKIVSKYWSKESDAHFLPFMGSTNAYEVPLLFHANQRTKVILLAWSSSFCEPLWFERKFVRLAS